MNFTWELILFSASAFHGIILSLFFLLSRSGCKKRLLGAYLLAFSLTILSCVCYWAKVPSLPFGVNFILVTPSWLLPALMYGYFQEKLSAKTTYLHLLIPLAFAGWWLIGELFHYPISVYQYSREVLVTIKMSLFLGYGVMVFRKAMPKKDLMERGIFLSYISIVGGLILYHISIRAGFYTLQLDYGICAVFVIFTYGITYLSQRKFLSEAVRHNARKYATSSLTDLEGNIIVQKIEAAISEEKLFTAPDFDLTTLSQKLNMPKYRISQALNLYAGKSFAELVNHYRVMEAQKRLEQAAALNLKLEAIGEDVGFKNKVSFYQNFKKVTGETPGQYRKRMLADSNYAVSG